MSFSDWHTCKFFSKFLKLFEVEIWPHLEEIDEPFCKVLANDECQIVLQQIFTYHSRLKVDRKFTPNEYIWECLFDFATLLLDLCSYLSSRFFVSCLSVLGLNFFFEHPEWAESSLIFLLLIEELSVSFDLLFVFSYGKLLSIRNECLTMFFHPRRWILMSSVSPILAG